MPAIAAARPPQRARCPASSLTTIAGKPAPTPLPSVGAGLPAIAAEKPPQSVRCPASSLTIIAGKPVSTERLGRVLKWMGVLHRFKEGAYSPAVVHMAIGFGDPFNECKSCLLSFACSFAPAKSLSWRLCAGDLRVCRLLVSGSPTRVQLSPSRLATSWWSFRPTKRGFK